MSNRRNIAIAATIALPNARRTSRTRLESAMSARRSIREFSAQPVTLAQFGQILWAAQGLTGVDSRRTAPSAGATYPLEIYGLVGTVDGIAPGIYRYDPHRHGVDRITGGDKRRYLAAAALSQSWIAAAAFVLVVAAIFERTTDKYGHHGQRYVRIEAGHAGQNVCLQAAALGLGTTVVGTFDDDAVMAVIGDGAAAQVLCLLPVGRI